MLVYFLFLVAGYAIGSVPFAYLIAHRHHGIDIRSHGSGNVGARNVFEVTSSKQTAILVLVLDMMKGLIPMIFLRTFWTDQLVLIPFACGIVLGHCYPVWLRFRGGRGLASAAGILLAISPETLVVWLLMYWLTSQIKPQVHLNAMAALVVVAFLIVSIPDSALHTVNLWHLDPSVIRGVVLALFVVLFSTHFKPVLEFARGVREREQKA